MDVQYREAGTTGARSEAHLVAAHYAWGMVAQATRTRARSRSSLHSILCGGKGNFSPVRYDLCMPGAEVNNIRAQGAGPRWVD